MVQGGVAHLKAICADTAWEVWNSWDKVLPPPHPPPQSGNRKGQYRRPDLQESGRIASSHPDGGFCNGKQGFYLASSTPHGVGRPPTPESFGKLIKKQKSHLLGHTLNLWG